MAMCTLGRNYLNGLNLNHHGHYGWLTNKTTQLDSYARVLKLPDQIVPDIWSEFWQI